MSIPRKFYIFIGLAALGMIPLLAFSKGGIGNGQIMETERHVESFTRIASNGSAIVRIHKSPEFRVVVATDARLQDSFEALTADGLLSLGFKSGAIIRRTTTVIVDVYMPKLESITISGSGKAELKDSFTGQGLKTVVSGSGSIHGSVSYDSLAASIAGSGAIRLSGVCPQLGVTVSGSGHFDGNHLFAVSASAILSGSGSINLDVGSFLAAVVSGSGRIRYSGDPEVSVRVSGTGTVRATGS